MQTIQTIIKAIQKYQKLNIKYFFLNILSSLTVFDKRKKSIELYGMLAKTTVKSHLKNHIIWNDV